VAEEGAAVGVRLLAVLAQHQRRRRDPLPQGAAHSHPAAVRRRDDSSGVGGRWQLFTELPYERIEELSKLEGADINEAKIVLADEATK
jgi:hypothetical protein